MSNFTFVSIVVLEISVKNHSLIFKVVLYLMRIPCKTCKTQVSIALKPNNNYSKYWLNKNNLKSIFNENCNTFDMKFFDSNIVWFLTKFQIK